MATPKAAHAYLKKKALGYPETMPDTPWDHEVVKVKKRIFVLLDVEDGAFQFTVKLPETGEAALTLPFTEPTGYGLAKSGWVTARFPKGKDVPVDMLEHWLDESYRAVAPKKLSAALSQPASADPPAAAKKPASAARSQGARRAVASRGKRAKAARRSNPG